MSAAGCHLGRGRKQPWMNIVTPGIRAGPNQKSITGLLILPHGKQSFVFEEADCATGLAVDLTPGRCWREETPGAAIKNCRWCRAFHGEASLARWIRTDQAGVLEPVATNA